jgi:hypothetical protein
VCWQVLTLWVRGGGCSGMVPGPVALDILIVCFQCTVRLHRSFTSFHSSSKQNSYNFKNVGTKILFLSLSEDVW